ncbi:MAG: type IX secretion system membrane protein PorP/SprF [Bacteroidota bacterium]
MTKSIRHMYFKKLLILISILFLGCKDIHAQQSPVFSQYMINKFLLNPAVAGGSGYNGVNLIAREQFVGFENAPRTFALTGQTRLLENSYIRRKLRIRKDANQASIFTNIGLGGGIFSDRNGIVSKTGVQISYAYHINFNNRYQLSMGLSGSAFQYKLDDSEAYLVDNDDPLLMGTDKQFWVPDAAFGVYFTDKRTWGGITITDLFGSSFRIGRTPIKENFSSFRNFNIMAGSDFNLNSEFHIKPSAMFRINSFESLLDFNTQLHYLDSYWFGMSYRTNNSLIAMLGINFEMLRFAYAYDATLGNINNYTSGSHEIIIGVRFGDSNTRRFRWLRKDEESFDI